VRLRRLTRSPLAYWLVVACLAGFTGLTASGLVSSARDQAAVYGRLRPVVIAARPVDVGAVVRPADVVVRDVPQAFLPEGRLPSAAAAVGRTVVVPLFRGAPVLAANLAPDGLSGLAALLPPGTRAVAVPVGTASVPVRRGDRVDVLATFDPAPAGEDPTFPVAQAALVVDVGTESVAVAVDAEEARRVAFAVARGVVALSLTAGRGGVSGTATPATPAPTPPPAPGTPRRG
jgi:Flp pilus assembly protein CpaB